MTTTFDCVIIGAGHNGLVCAAGLAEAGWRVLVLELAHVEPERVDACRADVVGPVRAGAALAGEPGVREGTLDVPAEHLEAHLLLELPVEHAELQGGPVLDREDAPRG